MWLAFSLNSKRLSKQASVVRLAGFSLSRLDRTVRSSSPATSKSLPWEPPSSRVVGNLCYSDVTHYIARPPPMDGDYFKSFH